MVKVDFFGILVSPLRQVSGSGGLWGTFKRIKGDKEEIMWSKGILMSAWPSGFDNYNILCGNQIFINSYVIAGVLRRLKWVNEGINGFLLLLLQYVLSN